MYGIAVGALADRRSVWGFWPSQRPTSILSGAVSQLEVLIARLRELRRVADDHAARFTSDGLVTLLCSLQHDLDDELMARSSSVWRRSGTRSDRVTAERVNRSIQWQKAIGAWHRVLR